MQAITYNKEGKETGKVELPESVFGLPWNADLVHGVVLAMQGNARAGTAHTKNRGEVRGSGRKPWRQKGTGRARAGSKRSPIWRGGGISHGPRTEKDYSRALNRNVRAKALGVTLSQKLRDDEIIFLDEFSFGSPKAKDAKAVLVAVSGIGGKGALATKRRNAALLVLPLRDEHVEKSFRNFGNMAVSQAKDINPVDLLSYKYVVLAGADAIIKQLSDRVATKATKATKNKTEDETKKRSVPVVAKK
ncbi:50S ribosomal protein L4 [Candidatus Kaiserbacteria bacterium]|nr:50S ribosomal protein L4 [Candidatus Kaiserbacteria bacterium]